MSLIARLGVVLGLNIEEFVKGTDEATKKTREYEYQLRKEIRKTEQAIGDAFSKLTVAATAFSAVLISTFKAADEISDIAKGFDTSIENLLATQAALQGAGGNAEDVATMFQKLAIAQDAAKEGSDEIRESFKRLGIAGGQVDSLKIDDLFKKVAKALTDIDDAGQRAAIAQDLLGKAVKGVNWSDFVEKYKEFKDPQLISAIEQNAQAWETIEKSLKEIKMLMMEIAKPFAILVNYAGSFANDMVKAQMAQRNMSFMSGGLGLGNTRGDPFAENRNQQSLDAMLGDFDYETPIVGYPEDDYKKRSKAQIAADKKNSDEKKRKQEAREALQIEIDLIKQKSVIAEKMYSVNLKAITLGENAVTQEKMLLDLASDIDQIRSSAAKERAKENAQIDLINAKETAAIDARNKQYIYDNDVRKKQQERNHELAIQAIRDESNSRANAMQVQTWNELNLLDLESERFKLGFEAYEIQKLQVEENNKLREIHLKAHEAVQQISREYELSAKSAEDLQLYEENLLKIRYDTVRQIAYTQAIEQKKQKNLEEQLKTEKELFALDLAQQKGRDIANIQSTLNIEKMRLDLESDRYRMSTNVYNLSNLALDNVYRLIEAEKKYNDQMKDAEYEMQRQGGGQKAREEYEQRIKNIKETRDFELDAIRQINDARQKNAENEIYRQRSFVDGWYYAAKQFQENSQNAFKRGEAAFQNVMNGMDAAISNFVETGKFKFEDFALSVIKNLIRMEMQAQATELFKSMVDMFTFNVASPLPDFSMQAVAGLRGMASGGAINSPTIVGENGAELFIPNTPGTIVPNGSWQQAAANMGKSGFVNNGTYIANMSAIDTQSATQFIASNKNTIWAAYQSANRSIPISR